MATYPVSPEIVIAIAETIARCDFRVTVSCYVTRPGSPWVITVGESRWQRHVVVKSVTVGLEHGDVVLAILEQTESNKFGYDVRTDRVEREITLLDLTADNYLSVKQALYPAAARV